MKTILKLNSYRARRILNSVNLELFSDKEINISNDFIDRAFSSKVEDGDLLQFIFLIPTRASRSSSSYWSEVIELMPIVEGLNLKQRAKLLNLIPPVVIDYYLDKEGKRVGAIVFSSIFPDILLNNFKFLVWVRVKLRLRRVYGFINKKTNAKYVGLGGILPRLTGLGLLASGDFYPTTGHAGTTWLILKTAEQAIDQSDFGENPKVGIIGGGAIGKASMMQLVQKHPNYEFFIYDIRSDINRKNYSDMVAAGARVSVAKDNYDLISKSQVIISAITGSVSLKDVDSIKGKVIIDDSQPPSFDRAQVNDKNCELLWVVGRSDLLPYKKEQQYKFGDNGLASHEHLWGCEAEVQTINYFDLEKLTVVGELHGSNIDMLEPYFNKAQVGVAGGQSFGIDNGE